MVVVVVPIFRIPNRKRGFEMIFKKILWVIVSCFITLTGIEYQISKAEIIMDKAPPDFAIVDYKVVSSNTNGNILDLTFQLFSKNRGDQSIYNVKVSLSGVPKYVIVYKGEVSYPIISPQEAVTSFDTIDISIDNYQQIDTLPFTWNIEYVDAKGRHQKGEIIVNYKRHLLYL